MNHDSSPCLRRISVLLASALIGSGIFSAHADPRTSANYGLSPETVDAGGARTTAGVYANDGSVGLIVGVGNVPAAFESARLGYAAQLYEQVGFAVTSGVFRASVAQAPASVNEGGTVQLGAVRLLDDSSAIPVDPSSIAWTIQSGPLISINANGVATAATVYQDSPAAVRAVFDGWTDVLGVTVRNVNPDDFGSYAADGLPDDWQVAHFGLENPLAAPAVDASGTGQTNLFKYIAGLDPLDPNSRFALAIEPVPGQPDQANVVFTPRLAGRIYTVLSTTNLVTPAWAPLGSVSVSVSDNGTLRTVTDLDAVDVVKFYRVEIAKP